ncbi:MAG TPA: CDP-alcohol phosphatidyltransferase family protein [Candidatus Limnocylindria bacterium]|nr:CDP-alcohol phosphatidyltransferase family protein [Candidatus Limnocylindria bacterium]
MNGNPRDGWLDRLLLRRLSAPLTERLLRTPVSPNAVTLAGLACGVAGGLALALPRPGGPAMGVLLLAASGVLDCCDGELARRRQAVSRAGHVLDVVSDTLVHLAVFAGVALVLRRAGTLPDGRWLAALAAGALASFAAITWSEASESRRRQVACWENRVLDGVLSPLTTRDWYVFPVLAALAGRLDALLVGTAVGSHVFWIGVVVLVGRALERARA